MAVAVVDKEREPERERERKKYMGEIDVREGERTGGRERNGMNQ